MKPPHATAEVGPALRALGDWLARPALGGRAMDVHAVQGLSAALALGPRVVSPALWMAWVWDREHGIRSPDFGDLADANAVLAWLMIVYNDVTHALGPAAEADEPFEPAFAAAGPEAVASFCAGFRRGIALVPEDWLPLEAEQPDWLALLQDPAVSAARILQLMQDLRRYWRGRTDKLPMLKHSDLWGQITEAFEYPEPPFPSEVGALANRHRELLAPRFVQELEALAQNPQSVVDSGSSLPIFAMVFLGCWRDTRAWRPLLALARLGETTLEEVFGDTITETYGRALASVCDGDMAPLAELLRDETVAFRARIALFTAWQVRVLEGDAEPGPLEELALELGQRCAAQLTAPRKRHADPQVIDEVANLTCDLSLPRLVGPVREWFDRGFIDTGMIDREFFEAEFARPLEDKRREMRERRRGYLTDVETETSWWSTFAEDDDRWTPRPSPLPTTIVRTEPKIGRNDPCPCGSGRKYKKCHGAN
jgi:yecA family protein